MTRLTLVAMCLLLQAKDAPAFAREKHAVGSAVYWDGSMGVPAHESDCNIKLKGHRDAINCYDYHLTGGRYETRFILSCTLLPNADHIKDRELHYHENILIDLGRRMWSSLPIEIRDRPQKLLHTSLNFVLRDKNVVYRNYDDLTINRYTGNLYHNYVIRGIETTITGKCRSKPIHNGL